MKKTTKPEVVISSAEFPDDRFVIMNLFTAYADSLEIDLTFQNFSHELSSLPGKYTPDNGGVLLIARVISVDSSSEVSTAQEPIGCVALRPFSPPHTCELKRLYIVPEVRGLGAGRKLLEAVLERAKTMGYKEMVLDTLPSMVPARKMYKAFGFEEVEKYYDNPIEGTSFMRLKLD
ncbi:acyl-CoA N-acyltransferase [Lindgomyces ingoldianus]|uniref:Acyl-CoA N-acyltransferase n=1 Tax=Lindgomyces ingoldianus TaxID=673940 RepID=A0ACB6R354_9PLEO|nr:acyl-CoA N-acyltransferase [Lindgomyces ingoldianus]KAF2472866.1 acyl-CoA N-acyltransferase [Lindgomyces ingoldianus]